MEVHKHPRHVTHKKKWTEYLLEFAMIFFAVFLGFIAENVRETQVEKEHAHQFAQALVHDLKNDTVSLHFIIDRNSKQISVMDSLFDVLQQPVENMNSIEMQRLASIASSSTYFFQATGTSTQLKNSGYLRLFSEEFASHLTSYEGSVAVIKDLEKMHDQYNKKFMESFLTEHLTPENMKAWVTSTLGYSFIPFNNKVRNLTSESLIQFSSNLMLYKLYSSILVTYYKRLKQSATTFILLIHKQYP